MEISLQTLLKVLIANGKEEYITKAIELEVFDSKPASIVGTTILADINVKHIAHLNKKFVKDRTYERDRGYYNCKVVSFNPYKMNNNYLVELPDGTLTYVSKSTEANPTPTEDIIPAP